MLEMLLDAENWFPVVTPLTAVVALTFVALACRRAVPAVLIVGGAFGVFFGLWLGIMGSGHLFAVTTKMVLGILPPRINPWVALPFGFAMAIPGWGLAWLSSRSLGNETRTSR